MRGEAPFMSFPHRSVSRESHRYPPACLPACAHARGCRLHVCRESTRWVWRMCMPCAWVEGGWRRTSTAWSVPHRGQSPLFPSRALRGLTASHDGATLVDGSADGGGTGGAPHRGYGRGAHAREPGGQAEARDGVRRVPRGELRARVRGGGTKQREQGVHDAAQVQGGAPGTAGGPAQGTRDRRHHRIGEPGAGERLRAAAETRPMPVQYDDTLYSSVGVGDCLTPIG